MDSERTVRREWWWRNGVTVVLAAGALWYWMRHDFVCDDAYIALRYARNLAEHGAAVYNLGERVEGYSSFSWVVLLAALMRVGFEPLVALRLLSAVSSALLIASTVHLWRVMWPRAVVSTQADSEAAVIEATEWRALVPKPALAGGTRRVWTRRQTLGEWGLMALLGVSAPVGAWAFGGLETPLFAALCTTATAQAVRLARSRALRDAAALGLVWAAASWTRPETPIFVVCIGLSLAGVALVHSRDWTERRGGLRLLLTAGAVCVALVGAHVAWRLWYYGAPLPNTYYAKTSGDAGKLFERGVQYVRFTFTQLGAPLLGWAVLWIPSRFRAAVRQEPLAAQSVAWWTARLWLPLQALYVARVGGDFLDLGRFFVPLVPLLCVALVSALCVAVPERDDAGRWAVVGRWSPRWLAAAVAVLGLVIVGGHTVHQVDVSQRAIAGKDRRKSKLGIESLKWTKSAAQRWAATGRWLRAHAEPDELMAVGAAGAMPYFAGIPNLDTFGLCDAHVARHGRIAGTRPGHQRFAPRSYIRSRKPVYVFVGDRVTTKRRALPRRHNWGRSFVWVRAVVDAKQHGAKKTFYHQFLMRRSHAERLAKRSKFIELE